MRVVAVDSQELVGENGAAINATGGEGNLEPACQHVIERSRRLYTHMPQKPIINGQSHRW
jgi:hypothetical protein